MSGVHPLTPDINYNFPLVFIKSTYIRHWPLTKHLPARISIPASHIPKFGYTSLFMLFIKTRSFPTQYVMPKKHMCPCFMRSPKQSCLSPNITYLSISLSSYHFATHPPVHQYLHNRLHNPGIHLHSFHSSYPWQTTFFCFRSLTCICPFKILYRNIVYRYSTSSFFNLQL